MIYYFPDFVPTPIADNLQIALAIAMVVLSVVVLWLPMYWVWRRRKKGTLIFPQRLLVFLVFILLFVGYWVLDLHLHDKLGMSFLEYDPYGNTVYPYLYVSFISIPVYFYYLFTAFRKSNKHFKKMIIITLGIELTFFVHLYIFSLFGFRLFG